MLVVLYAPVLPADIVHQLCAFSQACDVVACLRGFLPRGLVGGVGGDFDDGAHAAELVDTAYAFHAVEHAAATLVYPAVTDFHRVILVIRGHAWQGVLHAVAECPLVGLQGDKIVHHLPDNQVDNLRLAVHCISGHDGSRLERGSLYQPGCGLYLVALLLAGLGVRGYSPVHVVDAHDVRPSAICQLRAAHELAVNGLDDGPSAGGRVDVDCKEAGEL